MGLLGTLIIAAVVLAVQEHYARPSELPDTMIQKTSGALPNGDPPALSGVVDLNSKNTDESSAGPVNNIQEEANRADSQANETSLFPARPNDSARVNRPKRSHLRRRASARPRFVDLKTRLLALWHQFWREPRSPKAGH